jgi:WhiB family redox-sensing transcriptional regulator
MSVYTVSRWLRDSGTISPPEDLSWMDRGLCTETDPEAFFPEVGEPSAPAKRVCRSCDVRTECLDYALEHGEVFGVWGGLSERERAPLRRQYARESGTCPKGRHLMTEANTFAGPAGTPQCRACRANTGTRTAAALEPSPSPQSEGVAA